MICAEAGAGKTTLLAERSRALIKDGSTVAWLSIDHDDNDPYLLWSGIVAACDRATRADGPGPLDGVSVPTDRACGILVDFRDAIDGFAEPLWLVLDDLHEIVEPAALRELESLLLGMPAQLRLLIGCRYDPPLPLPRLIMEGAATEIRAADLAFDRAEADELLRGHGVILDDEDLSILLGRTEGWAAGLKLAALQLAGRHDPSKLVASFAGDDRPVADYLVTEIIPRLPAATTEVLLASAVPEWLTVSLACELSGRADAGAVLEALARENALVYRLGKDSYRLHSLLRSYLLAEVGRRDALAARQLHLRAADWFSGHALSAPALDHATAAEDWPGVAEILERDGLGLLLDGAIGPIRMAIARLPGDVADQPIVVLTGAAAALCDRDLIGARQRLDMLGPVRHAGGLAPYHAALLLFEARLRGTALADAAELAELASSASSSDVALLGLANSAMLSSAAGEYAAANEQLVTVCRLARDRGLIVADCLAHRAWNALATGDVADAVSLADDALAHATRRSRPSAPETLPAYFVRAWVAWQQLDACQVEPLVSVARAMDGDVEVPVGCAVRLLEGYGTHGGTVGKRSGLARRRAHADATSLPPAVLSTYCLVELRMALAAADMVWVDEVMDVAKRCLAGTRDIAIFDAVVQAHHGRSGTRCALDAALSLDAKRCSVDAEIAGWLVLAHLADDDGEPARAHAALVRALDIAADGWSKRELTAASERVRRLMNRGRGRFGDHEDLVEDVLQATKYTSGQTRAGFLAGEALTPRELDVLRDLPSMLSLSEIAAAHVVSLNTVKTHLKAIYRKLAVTSRREAVAQARDAGLL